jgi:hypothetical protein
MEKEILSKSIEYFESKKYKESILEADKLIEKNNKNYIGYYRKSLSYIELFQYNKGIFLI